ncbi:MAG: peptidylprolyl isomerase [Bacteroidota bacterium]
MNKLLTCFLAGIVLSTAAKSQTLFTYGAKTVSQAEFIAAFEKNPTPGNKRKAVEEYLPLYINYKLKVQDAIDKKMDTLSNQKDELANYRSQLVENYINTKSNAIALVKEAFNRSQKDILLGHLFIGFSDSAGLTNAATVAGKAKAALDAKEDFSTVVRQYSTDEANKASGGRVGWITAFSIPYQYETAVYDLPENGYSEVIKSSAGFHLFKKISERPSAGTVKLAQIMLINTEPGNKTFEEKNKKLADSLYGALINGASFDSLALAFSNDRTSYNNGGILPEFGVGTYSGVFEEQAFSLTNKGEISKPFLTEYGWHILKLVEKKATPNNLEDAEYNAVITQKVAASGRTESARNNFLSLKMNQLGFKSFPVSEQDLWQFTDSAFSTGNTKGLKTRDNSVLFSISGTASTVGQWVQFVKSARLAQGGQNRKYPELLQAFKLSATENYLQKNFEKIEPSFARQLKEFKDANLLFEAMDKQVWSKASSDEKGLLSYYNLNKNKYKWASSANALMITCTDSVILPEVLNLVEKDPMQWRQLNTSFADKVVADSGRYELTQLPANSNREYKTGAITDVIMNELDGSKSFAFVLQLLPANEQRSFEDARGFVINDYQQILEQRWINNLKNKYPVRINKNVFNTLLSKLD